MKFGVTEGCSGSYEAVVEQCQAATRQPMILPHVMLHQTFDSDMSI
jgi:hypothetical protein